jgi:hypothetical protein
MKESQWRAKLVKDFKQHFDETEGFIWAMDAKFKAGFPDLLLIIIGQTIHYELKIARTWVLGTTKRYFEPIQLSVMNSINKAHGEARGLLYSIPEAKIYMIDFTRDKQVVFSFEQFRQFWASTQTWEHAINLVSDATSKPTNPLL